MAIHAERNGSLPWAVMGIWKAGAAFMVLDPAYPPRAILERVDMARPQGWINLPGAGPMPAEIAAWARERPFRCAFGPADPRRSGLGAEVGGGAGGAAAGLPGSQRPGLRRLHLRDHGPVQGDRRQLPAPKPFLRLVRRQLRGHREDRFSLLSGLAHDPLLRDIFGPIWFGGSLHVPPPEIHQDAKRLGGWIRQQGLSVINCTPSLLRVVASEALIDEAGRPTDDLGLPSIRYVFTVGSC